MTVQELIGADRVGPVGPYIPAASGVPICLAGYRAVTFFSNEADGSTILTFTQHPAAADGTADTGSEASLPIQIPASKYTGATGATARIEATDANWTAAGTLDLADDATYDGIAITVRADQLSDDYAFVECTVDGGTLAALCHDGRWGGDVDDLISPVTMP